MSRLKKVSERLGTSSIGEIAAQPDRAIPVIEQLYQNAFTKRNIATDILSFYKKNPNQKTTAHDRWKSYHAGLTKKSQEVLADQKSQELAVWQERQSLYKLLASQEKQPHASLERSVRYLALLLNQIVQIKYFMDARYLVDVDIVPDKNCIVRESQSQQCTLYAQNVRKVLPKNLTLALEKSFQAYPRQYIFVGANLKPFTQTHKLMDLLQLPR